MNCYRANDLAAKDKEEIAKIQKDLKSGSLDAGAKIAVATRGLNIRKNHEMEKLKSLQDEALFRQNKTEKDRDAVTNNYIKASRAKLKQIDSQIQEHNGLKTLHEENKKQVQLNKDIAELDKKLKSEEAPPEKPKRSIVESEKITKLREQKAELQKQLKGTPWKLAQLKEAAIRNKATRLDRQTAELQRRLAENDLAPKRQVREEIQTPEILAKQDLVNKLRNEIDKKLERIEYENRTPLQKSLDFLNAFKRFSILSSPKSIAKLAAASTEVALTRGFTESAGLALRTIPILDAIANKAPIEGSDARGMAEGLNSYYRGFIKGAKEFQGILSGKDASFLEKKFGRESGVPQNWLGWFGRFHEAIKNPTRLANYEVGVERYLRWAERNGMDARDPAVINQAEAEAFKYANRSIFKEDNFIVQQYNNAVQSLKRGGALGKTVGFALEQTLPIVKIPTNILMQTFEYALGTGQGTVGVLKALRTGIDKLSPEEADVIMRQLKNGSAGLLMLAAGALMKDQIGGLYLTGEDKGEKDYGTVGPIPRNLLENPLFACLQIGSTMARFWENHMQDADTPAEQLQVIASGAIKTSLGLIEEAPFVHSMFDFEKIAHARDRIPQTFAEIYARPYIPAALQYVADMTDLEQPIDQQEWQDKISTLVAPKPTPRSPESFWQALELSIPTVGGIGRGDVPQK
jgi:hypothetical protein